MISSRFLFICIIIITTITIIAEDGHNLWLRGKATGSVKINCSESSPTMEIAINELQDMWHGKDDATITLTIISNPNIKKDGFKLNPDKIEANTELGILYGVYELLRRQQLGENIGNEIINPSYEKRLLNHWDNPDGTIERGYAGLSIFWRKGKDSLVTTDEDKKIWQEYARANASIGINGSVVDNVNSSPLMLTTDYLKRLKDIADVLRPYGIKVHLSVKFSSPSLIGGLETSDPHDPQVIEWWKNKVEEIYDLIPDFGGFLIKANSEGQPGPQDYGRTHADGANMLADALSAQSEDAVVMWRAFVYKTSGDDRAKQAYNEFMPLNGEFRDNVIIQVKNGPVDFQPREPFSPLFGAMTKTSVMPELQITQEYLGRSIHLAYLGTMWEEFLQSDTYQQGEGSTVAKCTDGTVYDQAHSAIAGVSNIGLDSNWCGHHFAQSNWYAFGRLAWDNSLSSEKIADEWIKLTFGNTSENSENILSAEWNINFLSPVKQMMLDSREAAVNYMMPLGLHHIFSASGHYGPGPWWEPPGMRKDWTPPYYHNADFIGVGFDRTATGSNAVSQYHTPLNSIFADINTCPEIFLLWFHHVSWDHKLNSGRTLWNELCYKYDEGVNQVRGFQKIWDKAERYVDPERFLEVQKKLKKQSINAQIWKDACLLYFQKFSKMQISYDLERPVYELEDLMKMKSFL